MFKRVGLLMAIVCALAFTVKPCIGSDVFNMELATCSVSSGNYPWAVGISEVVNKYVDGVQCRTIALGAAGLTIPALKIKQANFSTSITSWDMADIAAGTGIWKKVGPTDIRMFCIREFGFFPWYVARSANVNNVMDLKGKKINKGSAGSAANGQVEKIEDALHIGADWTIGGTATAKRQIQDRHIIGYIKSSPGWPKGSKYRLRFDASALDVNTSIPLKVVGFTQEQYETIVAKYPRFKKFMSKIPAGAIQEATDLPEMWVPTMSSSAMVVTPQVPQDIQYKIIKALAEHWQDTVAAAYPPCGKWDPIADSIEFISDGVYLAAGVVQYAKEKGIDVPTELIPPEYKE